MAKNDEMADERTAGWQEKYNGLKPDLRKRYEELRGYVTDEAMDVFRNRHRIGKLAIEIDKDDQRYGKKAVSSLENLLGMGRDYLRNAQLFAERYDTAHLEELIVTRNRNGDPLVWSHVVELIRIPNLKEMFSLQKRTAENNWTAADLRRQIQASRGGKKSKGGRPPLKPASENACLV